METRTKKNNKHQKPETASETEQLRSKYIKLLEETNAKNEKRIFDCVKGSVQIIYNFDSWFNVFVFLFSRRLDPATPI